MTVTLRIKIDENLPLEMVDLFRGVLGVCRRLAPLLHQRSPAGQLWVVEEQGVRIRRHEAE